MLSSEYYLQQAIDQLKADAKNIRFVRLKVLALSAVFWKYKIDGLLNASFAKKNIIFALSFPMGKDEMKSIQNVTNFLQSSRILRNIAVLILAMILVFTIPTYPVLKHFYGTYSDQYQWAISGLFLSGYQPAVTLILLWIFLLAVAVTTIKIYVPHKIQEDSEIDDSTTLHSLKKRIDLESKSPESNDSTNQSSDSYSSDYSTNSGNRKTIIYSTIGCMCRTGMAYFSESISYVKKFTVWISIITVTFNIAVVLTIKVVMIYLLLGAEITFTEKLFIEAALCCIDLFWAIILVPAFINRLPKKSALGKLILKVSLLYFNSLVAPFVVIGASDDSCFYGLFVASSQKEVTFVFPFCLIYARNGTETTTTNQCVMYSSWTSTKVYNSSFYYNYTCYSTILKEYIPIFVLSATLSILLIPVGTLFLISRTKRDWYFNLLPHIYWIEGANAFVESFSNASHSSSVSSYFLSSEFPTKDGVSFVDNPVNSFGILSGFSSTLSTSVDKSDSQQTRQLGASREVSPIMNLALTDPKNLFYPYVIIASMLHDILLLITFGIMCPLLAAAVVVNLCVTHFFWEILLARYICSICPSFAAVVEPFDAKSTQLVTSNPSPPSPLSRSPSEFPSTAPFTSIVTDSESVPDTSSNLHRHSDLSMTKDFMMSLPSQRESLAMRQRYTSVCSSEAIQSVDKLCRNVWHGPKKCLWLIVYGSALFFALVTLDMAGDQQGWLVAMWAPCSILFLALSILYLVRIFSLLAKKRQEVSNAEEHSRDSIYGSEGIGSRNASRNASGNGRKLSAVELTSSNIMFDKTIFTSQNVVIREKADDA